MAEAPTPSKIESARKWIVDHKLRAVGSLWLTGIGSSIAYNWSRPHMKTSVKLIHARMHAQALTLAAIAGSGLVEYYDKEYGSSGPKVDRYTRQRLEPPLLQNEMILDRIFLSNEGEIEIWSK